MKTSREDYRKQVEAQFNLWESRLAVLEARAGKAGAHARGELHRQLEELRKLQASARQHVEQIAAGSAAPWSDIKGGLEEAWSKWIGAMEAVWGRIKAEPSASERPCTLAERGAREPQEELPCTPTSLRAPPSVRDEHQQLYAALESATKAPGAVGETARELASLLHPHLSVRNRSQRRRSACWHRSRRASSTRACWPQSSKRTRCAESCPRCCASTRASVRWHAA